VTVPRSPSGISAPGASGGGRGTPAAPRPRRPRPGWRSRRSVRNCSSAPVARAPSCAWRRVPPPPRHPQSGRAPLQRRVSPSRRGHCGPRPSPPAPARAQLGLQCHGLELPEGEVVCADRVLVQLQQVVQHCNQLCGIHFCCFHGFCSRSAGVDVRDSGVQVETSEAGVAAGQAGRRRAPLRLRGRGTGPLLAGRGASAVYCTVPCPCTRTCNRRNEIAE
jgi:hypothetical protein